MANKTNLLSDVIRTLEAKFGLVNDAMTRRDTKSKLHSQFFNTSDPRVKIAVQHTFDKIGHAVDIYVSVAVEEEDRPGVFFNLGDRLHLDPVQFPQFKFHHDLRAKLTQSSARSDLGIGKDVLSFAKELTEAL